MTNIKPESIKAEKLNRVVLYIFAPLLIVTGIAGFVIPQEQSLTSGAAPYNIFHIVFGVIGLIMVLSGKPRMASFFNLDFGLIDLYQAVASFLRAMNVPAERLWTVGYGSDRPLCKGKSDACVAKNRRVHFRVKRQ